MHVWRNVILTGKKLIRQEIRTWNQEGETPERRDSDGEKQGKMDEYQLKSILTGRKYSDILT